MIWNLKKEEEDDQLELDSIRYYIKVGTRKFPSSCLKEILTQIQELKERIVPIEILNVPDSENLKLEKLIEQKIDEKPEYVTGKFILKTPNSFDKGSLCGCIFGALSNWNQNGRVSYDSIMITDQN
jgi:Ser-tRNA(Ala) deacylase AlaX